MCILSGWFCTRSLLAAQEKEFAELIKRIRDGEGQEFVLKYEVLRLSIGPWTKKGSFASNCAEVCALSSLDRSSPSSYNMPTAQSFVATMLFSGGGKGWRGSCGGRGGEGMFNPGSMNASCVPA